MEPLGDQGSRRLSNTSLCSSISSNSTIPEEENENDVFQKSLGNSSDTSETAPDSPEDRSKEKQKEAAAGGKRQDEEEDNDNPTFQRASLCRCYFEDENSNNQQDPLLEATLVEADVFHAEPLQRQPSQTTIIKGNKWCPNSTKFCLGLASLAAFVVVAITITGIVCGKGLCSPNTSQPPPEEDPPRTMLRTPTPAPTSPHNNIFDLAPSTPAPTTKSPALPPTPKPTAPLTLELFGMDQSTSSSTLQIKQGAFEWIFPTTIGYMTRLEAIDFSRGRSRLIGTIPSQIGLLGHLERLDVDRSQLVGSIPTQIGLLTKLQGLDLGRNALSGPVPSQIGLLGNNAMGELNLQTNELSGILPFQLGLLSNTQITNLRFRSNEFGGAIPTQLGFMTHLQAIDLTDNRLTGKVPSQLGLLSQLTQLDLKENNLSGTLPLTLCREDIEIRLDLTEGNITCAQECRCNVKSESTVEYIDGEDTTDGGQQDSSIPVINFLGFEVPMESVKYELIHQEWMGTFPTEIGLVSNLAYLALTANSIRGRIPSQLGVLTMLTALRLQENEMTGPIPTQLGLLTKLTMLNVASNKLSGQIPSQLGQLTALTRLILNENYLTGTLPQEVCNIPKQNKDLRKIAVDHLEVFCRADCRCTETQTELTTMPPLSSYETMAPTATPAPTVVVASSPEPTLLSTTSAPSDSPSTVAPTETPSAPQSTTAPTLLPSTISPTENTATANPTQTPSDAPTESITFMPSVAERSSNATTQQPSLVNGTSGGSA